MPINTPETDLAIASQEGAKQGDFSAARIPSPGPLPYPQAPAIANVGTGDTQEQTTDNRLSQGNSTVDGGNVDANFMNKVLGVKDKPFTVGKLPTYTADQVNNQRYTNFLPGADNEERAANAQSTSAKWGNAFAKFAATTIGTFYNGMMALPSTINLARGKNLYSSLGANSVDTWMNSFEEKFPNYYTKWEQDHPFISAIPFVSQGGLANFWGDKFLKNMGFTVGAIASAAVTDMAVGAVTGGIGEIPLIGNQVGRAAIWLNKIFGAGKVAELGEGVNAAEQSIFAAQNLKRAAGLSKLYNGTRYAINSYAAAASEAGFEARDGYNTTRQDLINAYKNENGYSPMGKELEDIEASARASANVRFGANLVLLGVSNAIQFDNLLKPWSIAKAGVKSTLEKEIGESGKIALQKGSIDTFEASKLSKWGKIGNFARPYVADILAEGVYEEGGQYAAQVATQNYYERKYLAEHKMDKSGYSQDISEFDSHNPINEILHSTIEGMKAEFGTTEGQENIFLGALTGVVSGGGKAIWDRFRGQGENHHAKMAQVLGFLNDQRATGVITNLYDDTVETHRIAADMKAAVKTKDLFKYKNYQHEMFAKFITSGLQAGRFDVRMEQLDLLKDMPQDKFKEAFGMDKSDADVKTVTQYVDLMKSQAQDIKRTYDLVNDTFGNPFSKRNSKRLTAEQAVENTNYETFEKLKGDLTYLASIQGDVRDRQTSITNDIKKLDPRVDLSMLRTLTNHESLKEYNKNLTQQRDDLQKASEEPTSPTKKEDAKEAADLTKKIDLINATIANSGADPKQYEQMFTTILSHELNANRTADTAFPAYDVPPEAIPQLIKFGVDSNRLTKLAESGKKTFEALATQKGAQKYFNDFTNGNAAYADRTDKQTNPEKPTQTPQPNTDATATQQTPENTPIPTPPTITITSADGKKSRTFEQGTSYYLNTGKETREKVTIERANGNVVTVKNEAGEVFDITADQAVEEDEKADAINEALQETEPVNFEEPPTDEENEELARPYEEEDSKSDKKDVSEATRSSIDPDYHTTQDFNNFHKRHSDFLWNMESYDKNVFNQANRDNIRAIFVNKKTATKMGFPDNFIDNKQFTGDNEPIRRVYILQKGREAFFVDKNGNQLTNITSGIVDPNAIIFSNELGPSLNYNNGKPRFTDKQGKSKEILEEWIKKRRQIIAYDGPIGDLEAMNFKPSRGKANIGKVNYNLKNSPVKAGLIKEADLDRPIIKVSTLGSVTPPGVGNISAQRDGIPITSGKYVLATGISQSWLNARKLNTSEATNIFNLLKYLTTTNKTDTHRANIFNYMRGVINMSSLTHKNGSPKAPLNSSIILDGEVLFLGKERGEDGIPMFPDDIEKNKDRIIKYLESSYHNVDNGKLSKFDKNKQFITVKVQDNKIVTDKEFNNYNRYLLSDANGREDAPLTTNFNTTEERNGEPPFIQKYSVLDTDQEEENNQPAQPSTKKAEPVTIATNPTIVPAVAPIEQELGVKKVDISKLAPSLLAGLNDKTKAGEMVLPQMGISVFYGDVVTDPKGNIIGITPIGSKQAGKDEIQPINPAAKNAISTILLQAIQASQVLKDDTNTSKQSTRDKLAKVPPSTKGPAQYRTVFSTDLGGNNYRKIDVDAEFNTFKNIVGDRYTLNKLDHILRKTDGGFAWGAVKNAMLYVYREAPAGTIYHEAFEAVWGNFLTGKEQQELYNEFVTRQGKFKIGATQVDFSKASLAEAKEQMAEEFADYRQNKDLNGELNKKAPKLLQWFKNFVNFVKKIIFGRKDQINHLFDRMNQGYYRNYNNNIRNIDEAQYSTARNAQLEAAKLPEYMIQDTIQGMTVEMFQQLANESSDIVDLLEEKRGESANVIYQKLLEKLSDYFEGEQDGSLGSETVAEAERLKDIGEDDSAPYNIYDQTIAQWEIIKANWPGFVAEHKRFLRIFSVNFSIDDEGNVTANEEDGTDEDDNKSQSEYRRDFLTVDSKNSAASVVKLLMASVADSIWRDATSSALAASSPNLIDIRRDNSSVGLPKAAQYAKLFNYILHTSANIGNIYDVVQNLYDRVSDKQSRKDWDANVMRLLNKVKFSEGFKGLSYPEQRVILKLEAAIVKNKPDYDRQLMDQTGSVYYKQSLLNTKTSQVVDRFLAGIAGSGAVQPGDDVSQGVFRVTDKVINHKRGVEYLASIGIPISKKEFNRVRGTEKAKFNEAVNSIKGVLENAANGNGVIQTISGQGLDLNDRLIKLAEVYVNNISGDDAQSQHPNLDNQQTSSFVTNNFVITQLNDLNKSATRDEFLSKVGNTYLRDLFHQDAYLLNKMFDEKGDHIKDSEGNYVQARFTVVEGLQKWNGDNTSASKLTPAIRLLFEINNNNNGTFYTLLPADSTTENAIKSGTFIDKGRYFGSDGGKLEQETRFRDQMYAWLNTEINLAKDYKTNKNRQNIEALKEDSKFDPTRTTGASLRFFQDILDADIVNDINKKVIDGDQTLESVMNRTTFDAQMLTLVGNQAEKNINYLKDWQVFVEQGHGKTYVAGLDKAFLKETLGVDASDIYSDAQIRQLMQFREMNYIISNIDMHKMFFSDPAQYKDELKRIKSFLSGRDYTHVDVYDNTDKSTMGLNAALTISRNGVGDFTKPNDVVQLKPTDPGYKVFSNFFQTATLKDVFTSSDNNRPDYDENNEADSQAYIMPGAYRELMIKAGGRWTNAQERQFQRDMAWTRLEMKKDGLYKYSDNELEKMDQKLSAEQDDSRVAYQGLKIIHSGVQDVNGTAVASIDKASWQMLNYKWFKNRNLGHLFLALQNKGIDYVRMQSAHKVGTQTNSTTDFYDKEGNFNKEGIQGLQTEQVSLKHLGIQVEQGKKERGQTEGSQARKIITMDLLENGVPRDYTGTNKEWNALTEDEKRRPTDKGGSDLYNKVRTYDEAVSNLVDIRTNGIMRKLGITPTYVLNEKTNEQEIEGYEIEDKTKVSKFILRELERRELPRNIAYGLDIDPNTNDFRVPLEANAQYQKIRQIIYSVVESTVQRPKFTTGGQKTMVSVLGMESGPRIVKKTLASGKPIYTSTELKTYEVSKDGKKTTACEIMLPYFFEKKILAAQKLGATIKTRAEVLAYLKTADGKELLKGIGFRIPTQGLNSLDFFVVKDFLPDNMGDSIVFPPEITTKAGSDFDIDKMNIYLKNFYIDHATGFPKVIKTGISKNIDTNNEQVLRDYYEKNLLEAHKEYTAYLKQRDIEQGATRAMSSLADKVTLKTKNLQDLQRFNTQDEDEDLDSLESEPDYVPSIDEFILENKGKPAGNLLSKEAAENAYVDAMEDLLSENINYKALTQPNSAKQLKDLRDRIVDLREHKEEDLIKNKPFGKMLSSLFMMEERQAYLSSKSVVGIAAIANTFHSLSQGIQGSLLYWGRAYEGFKIRFDHNYVTNDRGEKIPTLSGLTIAKHSDVYISNIISQIIDGGVDVTKDKFLADMGINRDTLPVLLGLVRTGVSPRAAITFLNQPIIQEYLRRKAINESVPIGNKGISSRVIAISKNNLHNIIKQDVRFKEPNTRLLDQLPDIWSITEMETMIKADQLTQDQKARQWQMLDDYLNYVQMGWDMFNIYQGYNWDTGNFGDPNMTRIKNLAYKRANLEGQGEIPMTKAFRIVQGTFLGAMRHATWSLDNAFKSIIRVQRGVAGDFLTDLSEQMARWYGANMRTKQQKLLKAEINMIDYSMQNDGKLGEPALINQIGDLLMGHRSTAHYVNAMQKSNIKKIVENPFIKNLNPIVDGREGHPSTVTLLDRDYDTYTSNVWTDAFREMKDDATVIYADEYDEEGKTVGTIFNDLIKTFILQFGGNRTSNSATHLIPNDVFEKYANSATQVMNLINFDTVGSFYRNNINDRWIVPLVEEDTYTMGADGKPIWDLGKFWKHVTSAELRQIFKSEKGAERVYLLDLNDNETNGRKFVKRVDPADENKYQLFQRIEIPAIDTKEGLKVTSIYKSLYKQINIWGSNNPKAPVQEHHQFGQPSVLTGINPTVIEMTDDYIIDALRRAGIKTNIQYDTAADVVADSKIPPVNADQQLGNTSESTDDGDAPDNPTFMEINPDEVKRSGKRTGFNRTITEITGEGKEQTLRENTMTELGYKVNIPSHPDMEIHVFKTANKSWILIDSKTGKSIGRTQDTAQEAIAEGIKIINKASLQPENKEKLIKLGLKKYDEPDRNLGECK